MSDDAAATTWLPQDAFDRLQAEYEDRTGPLRTDITKKIEAAREEGDLKENGGYHAAKDEQGKNEARIRQLRQLLENAQVGEAPESDGTAQAGMVVTVRFEGDDESDTTRFLLGHREANADSDLDVYSPTSPLGAALLGATVGDSVSYVLPNGRKASVELVAAERFTG